MVASIPGRVAKSAARSAATRRRSRGLFTPPRAVSQSAVRAPQYLARRGLVLAARIPLRSGRELFGAGDGHRWLAGALRLRSRPGKHGATDADHPGLHDGRADRAPEVDRWTRSGTASSAPRAGAEPGGR